MKTFKLYVILILAIFITTHAYSQEQVLASQIANNPTEPPATTAVAAGLEEKQEEEPTFTFSGSVDTYFHTSFGSENWAPPTAFANLKGFGIGMVNLIATYSGEKAGFTADLVFGPRGRDAVFANYYTGQSIINQAYGFYKVSDAVTFNLGQFNTFLGYEVISPAINFHYSTSYLFSYGPFNHTGLRADFTFGNGMVAKLAVMNPTDIVEFNPVNTYTLGGQIGHTSDAGGIWLNLLYGDQDGTLDESDFPYVLDEDGNPTTEFVTSAGSLFQADITAGYNLSDKFYLGFNTSVQSVATGEEFVGEGEIRDSDGDATSFYGVALYPKLTLSETFALGVRAEYFAIKKGHLDIIGLDNGGDGSVTALTLTANYKVGGLTIIPEFRIDTTSEDTFQKKDSDEFTKSLPSLTVAAVYKF